MPRIVGGTAKGRNLKQPAGDVRPATARIRQALFDYLGDLIDDALMLDLYCGSGGLGYEALSRGARGVWFVDLSEASIETVKQNGQMLRMEKQIKCVRKDVFRFIHWYDPLLNGHFDIVMASPPYKISEPTRLLIEIAESGVLAPRGIVVLEYSRHTDPPVVPLFTLDRRKIYGETVVEIWDYDAPPQPETTTAEDQRSLSE